MNDIYSRYAELACDVDANLVATRKISDFLCDLVFDSTLCDSTFGALADELTMRKQAQGFLEGMLYDLADEIAEMEDELEAESGLGLDDEDYDWDEELEDMGGKFDSPFDQFIEDDLDDLFS